jgi:UDP:flavonoid glycosyltransferase YjiC (YdhE family)
MPNTVAVGDIMAGRPGSPLPNELENFVAASTGGVIVASFGSYFDYVPPFVTEKFCDAFRRLGPTGHRVVWKLKNPEICRGTDKHVKIMPWIPQNDLLADSRVRVFITHGGLNSMIEAAYHAKPIIVFPIAGDQPFNAAAAESKGFAIRMDISDFNADSLVANIDKMIRDSKYEQSAQLCSSIVRDRRDTPGERASQLIDHVIKYGDSHLRTGAFELNDIQFMMFDIFAFVFLVCLLAALVVGCVFRCIFRLFRNGLKNSNFRKRQQSKTKRD